MESSYKYQKRVNVFFKVTHFILVGISDPFIHSIPTLQHRLVWRIRPQDVVASEGSVLEDSRLSKRIMLVVSGSHFIVH